jgi:U3 small nucleolar RNA-associated protein 4
LSLGAGQNNGAKASEIFTWAVKCLSDGTIISGDSTGEIKIWDPATSTLMQRIKAHTSDVLTISPSADGMSMMSGGMDKRTVVYKRTGTGKQKTRWAEISHQRLHSSDIKAMASFEGGDMRVIASGGLFLFKSRPPLNPKLTFP